LAVKEKDEHTAAEKCNRSVEMRLDKQGSKAPLYEPA
jgi:hypothetical protein